MENESFPERILFLFKFYRKEVLSLMAASAVLMGVVIGLAT